MFGVIVAVVVVVTVIIGAVGRYLFKRKQAETRRREMLARASEPLVFIPGPGNETITGLRVPPPTYNVDTPPSYADISRKSEGNNESMV